MRLLHENFESELATLAEDAEEIRIVIAFLTESGLDWLPERKRPLSHWIVGTDLGITSPRALRVLLESGAGVRVFQEPGRLFHPKAVYVRTAMIEALLVGSANLTARGIGSNHEVGLLCERTDENEQAFSDFLAHFQSLQTREYCFEPDDDFFVRYRQSNWQERMVKDLWTRAHAAPSSTFPTPTEASHGQIRTLSQFLEVIGREFPSIDRTRTLNKAGHPLSVLNREFFPVFRELVQSLTEGRLTGSSMLHYNAQWYRIPNILATEEDREPYERSGRDGALSLQIHYIDEYQRVAFSIVLRYQVARSNREGSMPEPVARRYRDLLAHLNTFGGDAEVDGPAFLHWAYDENHVLWSKPLLSYKFRLENMPGEEALHQKLVILANTLINSPTA